MSKKYVCHVIGTGFIATLIVFASNCQPLGNNELTHIAQQYFNASCYVSSFGIEPPELPQNHNAIPLRNSAVIGTANASATTTAVPFTGLTKMV